MRPDDLRRFVKDYVEMYPTQARVRPWWRRPLLATAAVDQRFEVLRRVVDPTHALPSDLLPSARSIVVFFLPFKDDLVAENAEGEMAVRNWGLAYVETNTLISRLNQAIADLFRESGHASAQTPATHNFDPQKLISRWSHKHLGHLAGLGRLGHHAQLITPAGSAGRLGSLVTEAFLGDSPLVTDNAACLAKAGQECLECVAKCPSGALTADGLDRRRCYAHLRRNEKALADLPQSDVCGKCVCLVRCSLANPVGA